MELTQLHFPNPAAPPLLMKIARPGLPGVGSVFIYNASAQTIISMTVDSTPVTLPGGYLAGTPVGGAPQVIQLPRLVGSASSPAFGAGSVLAVTFVGGQNWMQTINLSSYAPSESAAIWCFYNGFAVSDSVGNMRQLAWG